jgi:glycosyltransferase involved in cell wall biosynthesis
LNVTVYSAAFNRAGWLPGCVASVEAQDYPHKRMMVVDDHSEDDTFGAAVKLMVNPTPLPAPEGAERFVAGQTRSGMNLAVARLDQNRGPAGARNWAIKANWAGADVFGNLDSDDRYRDGYLSKMMPLFRHAEVGAVYCDYETVSAQAVVREFKEPFSGSDCTRTACCATTRWSTSGRSRRPGCTTSTCGWRRTGIYG